MNIYLMIFTEESIMKEKAVKNKNITSSEDIFPIETSFNKKGVFFISCALLCIILLFFGNTMYMKQKLIGETRRYEDIFPIETSFNKKGVFFISCALLCIILLFFGNTMYMKQKLIGETRRYIADVSTHAERQGVILQM